MRDSVCSPSIDSLWERLNQLKNMSGGSSPIKIFTPAEFFSNPICSANDSSPVVEDSLNGDGVRFLNPNVNSEQHTNVASAVPQAPIPSVKNGKAGNSTLKTDGHKTNADSVENSKVRSKDAINNSYASKLKNGSPTNSNSGTKVNFRLLPMQSDIDGIDLVIPIESVKEINSRFSNTLYGYFLGNRLAFPVVEHYVKNTWAKFGLQRMMMNDAGFFFFQFSSKQGLEQVLEKGPWLIRSTPILLNVWTPNICLAKQDTTKIPVWVKIYDVPLVAFTEDGLSMIASKIGNPLMLDSYTSQMCSSSWGRHSYARAMIELNASETPRENLSIAIPNVSREGVSGEGFSKHEIRIAYEWKPSHCVKCKVFGHESEVCPRHDKVIKQVVTTAVDDGFTAVARRKSKGTERQVEGIRLTKPKPQFVYRRKQPSAGTNLPGKPVKKPITSNGASSSVHAVDSVSTSQHPSGSQRENKDGASISTNKPINTHNTFSVLGDGEDDVGVDTGNRDQGLHENRFASHDSDDDEVEVIYDESLNKG